MSTLTINLNDSLKESVQKKAKAEGQTLTSLIAAFFKSYLNSECELCIRPKKLKKEIWDSHLESEKEIKSGKAKVYNTVQEMFDDILNESDEI